MLMMLALRFAESVQSVSNCYGCLWVQRPEI